MPAFKDMNNREWLVSIDAPKIREVRDRLQLDLVAKDGSGFERLAEDPVLLVDCLWVLVGDQHEGVTDVQFGKALGDGDVIEGAVTALNNAVLSFFRPAQRSLLRSLDQKETTLKAKAAELVTEKINDPGLEEKFLANVGAELDKGIQRMLSLTPLELAPVTPKSGTGATGATSSPASAELIPPG